MPEIDSKAQKPPAVAQAQHKPHPAGAPKPGIPGKPVAAPAVKESESFRGVIRLAGKDIDGHLVLYRALLKVKGIGSNMAKALERAICKETDVTPKTRVGDLTDEQADKIDVILHNPSLSGIKAYLFNRANDRDSGKNVHLLMNDLVFATRQDVQLEKDSKSWKGWRHSLGQRVRGQHTRTTGRSGLTVGVMRKTIKEQKAAAAAGAPDKAKK
ncbi:MAG: 30S ribosomal protein S13 [Candidatus Micrarchaeota archaeon]